MLSVESSGPLSQSHTSSVVSSEVRLSGSTCSWEEARAILGRRRVPYLGGGACHIRVVRKPY
eukprot:6780037-Prymnesium_polylepis.1